MTPASDQDSYRVAYLRGITASRDRHVTNPYLPADPDTRRLRLAQMWQRGRLHDMPARFSRD